MPRHVPESPLSIISTPVKFLHGRLERFLLLGAWHIFMQYADRFFRGVAELIGISIITVLPIIASAAPITMGETAVFGSVDSGNGNLLLVQDATLSEAATLQSLSFYIVNAAGQLRLGVYDATGAGGNPGNLIAETQAFTPVAGWNTVPIITPAQLPAGNYWLAYFPSSSSLSFATNFSAGSFRAAARAFGPMPASFPTITIQGTTHWSLYATLNSTPDTAAPSVPAGVSATAVSSTEIDLTWSASNDNVGVAGYRVFRDGIELTTTTAIAYSDGGLVANTSYAYTVSAFDAAGNVSAPSLAVVATTLLPPPPDSEAPSIPTGLQATNVTASSATLAWLASSDNVAVAGYLVFRDGGQVGTTAATTFTDPGLASQTSYTYTVAAYDAAGNVSAPSLGVPVTTTAASAPITMGETAVFGSVDSGNGNLLLVQDATLSEAATLQSLSFYIVNAAGQLRLGVYDATGAGGNPGNLIAETQAFTPVAGWNTVPIITPAQLPAGNYWLAYFPSSSSLSFATNFSAGSFRAAARAFGPMPASFPTITIQGTTHWSLYATLNSAPPSPDILPPTIFVDSPENDALVSGILNITAQADDDVGVVGVQFFIDGIQAGSEDSTSTWGYAWDTRTASNGSHILTARARDAANNTTTSDPVVVNVSNASQFQNEILVTGLNLPTALKFLPDGRMLVTELPGTIKVLAPPYTSADPESFLELDLNITGYEALQQGIFDVALDPNFSTNRYFYIFYTNDSPNVDRLSRFTANTTLDGTVPGSEVILYEDPQPANTEHHGGAINFGNDGKIYFTTGEHFDAGLAQDLTNPRGKIHRINADGTVPIDNPFYDGGGPNWDSLWAFGLRNPYRAYFDLPSDKLYIGDVGGNEYSTAYEELNVGEPGANYGWPDCEFGTCGNPDFTPALYAYAHNGRDSSITGGFIYRGAQFPAQYVGSYFFGDYAQNWIKYITFDAQGNVSGVFNFEPADGSPDGPYGDIVYLTEGPDGALYYIDLGYSDVGGTFGISKIRRIRYVQANQQPTAIAAANPSSGPAPLTVSFSSAGSIDPEGAPLGYYWDFGDGTTSNETNPSHVYAAAGQYTARLTVSDGVSETLAPPLLIDVGHKPIGAIVSPLDGSLFIGGQSIFYSGTATDTEDGELPASAFTWDIDFLHAGHVHPGAHVVGVTSGIFAIPTSGHDFGGNTRYRITLRVTDSSGLTDEQAVVIFPDKVIITLDAQTPELLPLNLDLSVDGIPHSTPVVIDTLANFQHTIEATDQPVGGDTYTFVSWSDGGAQTHTITVPTVDFGYIATFEVVTASDTAAPSVPAGVSATAVSSTEIDLTWSASNDNVGVAGYRVFRDGIELTTTTAIAYSDGGLVANTSYAYTVSAFDAAGNVSAPSLAVVATTLLPPPPDSEAPSIPTGLQATNVTASSATLAWLASSDNVAVAGYLVFRDGGQVGTTAATTFTDPGLASQTSYTYTVAAYDAAGNVSAPSLGVPVTTTAASAPITMGETAVFGSVDSGNGNLLLVQDATLSEAATLQSLSFYIVNAAGQLRLGVYDATGAGGNPGNLIAETQAFTPVAGWNTVPIITPAQLPAGNYWLAYFPSSSSLSFATNFSAGSFRAAARAFGPMPASFPTITIQGTTHWSLYATLNSTPDTAAPSVPAGVSATAVSSTEIDLTWSASNDNVGVAGYRVFRDGIELTTTTAIAYSDGGLVANTSYAYTVSAFDAAGNVSAPSLAVVATTLLPPPPDSEAPSIPTGLQATNVTASSATLAWLASSDNVAVAGYLVFRDGGQVGTTAATTFTDPGLASQTSYTYTVAAYDAAGNVSAPSLGVPVTTTAASAPITMGETAVFGSVDSGNGNLLLVQDATLSEAATLQSLSFYIVNAAGQLRLGVYDATGAGGNPGNLIAETQAFTPVAGWNTVPIITPAQLPAGNYWLAYFPSSSSLSFATNFSAGSFRAAARAFGPMPASFPTITIQGTTHWSLFGSLTP